MFEYYFWSALLRFVETIIYSSMWIVIGCMVAGIFRRMLGPEKLRKLFGSGGVRGIVMGWCMGMLLPVCSLGVIPVVAELHRSKVKAGTIIAFGLTAPLFNPLSVLYGLTLSDPFAVICFAFCSLVIVSVLGLVWDRIFPEELVNLEKEAPTPGIQRVIATFYTSSKTLVGRSGFCILIGIVCSVLLAVLLEKGYLMDKLENTNRFAPVFVAMIATPVYSTPLLVMSQIGGMFQHGNSIGAAFSLLILGAGTNIGLLFWFGSTFGFKRFLIFFSMLFVITVGLAYAINDPLYPKGTDPEGHTHAFDIYSNPFHKSQPSLRPTAEMLIRQAWEDKETGGTKLMVGLIVLGIGFHILGLFVDFEKWFRGTKPKRTEFDINVPEWILAVVCIGALIYASIHGCYLYYPGPDELLAEMSPANTNCVLAGRTKNWEVAEKWIRYTDDLSRRLEVGVFLRKGGVSEFHSAKAKEYRDRLEDLKTLVEARNPNNIDECSMAVLKAYESMRKAFKEID